MPKLLLLLLLLSLCACGTRYKQLDDSHFGYFQNNEISKTNQTSITFRGNRFTSWRRAKVYAMYRAAKIGKENGYNYFLIKHEQKRDDITTGMRLGKTSRWFKSDAGNSGDFRTFYATKVTQIQLDVEYYKTLSEDAQSGKHAVDSVLKEINKRYQIRKDSTQ